MNKIEDTPKSFPIILMASKFAKIEEVAGKGNKKKFILEAIEEKLERELSIEKEFHKTITIPDMKEEFKLKSGAGVELDILRSGKK